MGKKTKQELPEKLAKRIDKAAGDNTAKKRDIIEGMTAFCDIIIRGDEAIVVNTDTFRELLGDACQTSFLTGAIYYHLHAIIDLIESPDTPEKMKKDYLILSAKIAKSMGICVDKKAGKFTQRPICLLYTSPSPRDS